jgi:hypothetical protein
LRRPDSPELESVARIGIGTGSISVSIFLHDLKVQEADNLLQILLSNWLFSIKEVGKGSS